MSQVERTTPVQVEPVAEEDRVWLQERVEEYKDLLSYLREH